METGRKGIAGNGGASRVWKGELHGDSYVMLSTSLRCFPIYLEIFFSENLQGENIEESNLLPAGYTYTFEPGVWHHRLYCFH